MLSSGGLAMATSFEISPVVLLALVALEAAALPKNDIFLEVCTILRQRIWMRRWASTRLRLCKITAAFKSEWYGV